MRNAAGIACACLFAACGGASKGAEFDDVVPSTTEASNSNTTTGSGGTTAGASGGAGGTGESTATGSTAMSSTTGGGGTAGTTSVTSTMSATSTTGSVEPTACDGDFSCGGDLIGRYEVLETCVAAVNTPDITGCEDLFESASLEAEDYELEFTASGEVLASGSNRLQVMIHYSAVCLESLDLVASPETCEGLAQLYQDQGYETTCALAVDACRCEIDQLLPADSSRTYQVEGNQVLLDGSAVNFCVEGELLRLGSETSGTVLRRIQ